mgnify:CR=1 FL=1
MAVSDPVADFLTCVRNAIRAKHRKVDVPPRRLKTEIAKVLLRERFINNFKVIEDSKQGVLRIYLKYARRRRERHHRHPAREHAGAPRVRAQGRHPARHGRPRHVDRLDLTRHDDRPRGPRSRARRRARLPGLVGGDMSRMGKRPVAIPGGVTVAVADEHGAGQGPEGRAELARAGRHARWRSTDSEVRVSAERSHAQSGVRHDARAHRRTW